MKSTRGHLKGEFTCGPSNCPLTLCLYRKQSRSRPSRLHSEWSSLRAQPQTYARTRPSHAFRLNKAVSFSWIEPFNGTSSHSTLRRNVACSECRSQQI